MVPGRLDELVGNAARALASVEKLDMSIVCSMLVDDGTRSMFVDGARFVGRTKRRDQAKACTSKPT